ncbi:uncharacterized protein LOC141815565 [Curcuma longa]|uniref:uncharacterized protein LOC141815565 n=1 Tax=Curcuma longa TaxID=136217 RepID=UPI003D9F0F92
MLKSEMNDKWRQWKHDLKRAFDPSKTEEEIASTLIDDRVDPGQYRALVHHWFSEEGQKISGINKQNRAKLEDTHCMGTKSLPVVIDEKKKKNKGVLPERHVVYIDTRTRKNGTIVNDKAADVIDEIKKHVSEGETSQASQSKQGSTFWKDDLLAKVQGPENEKRGRVRCLGKIPPAKKAKASSSTDADLHQEVAQIKGLLTNVLKLMQNHLPEEAVQNILQLAAEQVPDASSKPNDQNNSGSQSS